MKVIKADNSGYEYELDGVTILDTKTGQEILSVGGPHRVTLSPDSKVEIKRRFPISDDHRAKLLSLAGVTCLPGSFDKRFIRNLQGATELTEKQAALIDKMVHRYRRQITGQV